MSRSKEIPKTDGIDVDHLAVSAEPQHDSARGVLAREAARREMDGFRGPAEYTIRKLIGRRSAAQIGGAARSVSRGGK
jgi:hypothetical protein